MKVKSGKKPQHQQSLSAQIEQPEEYGIRTVPRAKKRKAMGTVDSPRKRQNMEDDADLNQDQPMPEKLTKKILHSARQQQAEVDSRDEDQDLAQGFMGIDLAGRLTLDDGDEASLDEGSDDGFTNFGAGEDIEEVEVEDEEALQAFLSTSKDDALPTLADLIMEKLAARARGEDGKTSQPAPLPGPPGMTEQAIEVYREIGKYLSRYTTGKIPKAFKMIPSLRVWDEVLFLTSPQTWSPHATYYATRLFIANLNDKLAQRYLSLVLLPKSREYIAEHKKLHPEIFRSLKKAAFKPGAFYRGLILPLCKSGTCTVREAVVFSTVVARTSIHPDHSAAALKCLAEFPYSGTTSFFIRTLLDKQYKLPLSVIGDMVEHFMRFEDEQRTMPVVWHQSMLCFVQRYKQWLTPNDRVRLKRLCRKQSHYQVTPEVHRELDHMAQQEGQGNVGMVVDLKKGKQGGGEDVNKMAPLVLD